MVNGLIDVLSRRSSHEPSHKQRIALVPEANCVRRAGARAWLTEMAVRSVDSRRQFSGDALCRGRVYRSR
jgi:hypothetical protein